VENFTYFSPTRVVFGKGSLAELPKLVPPKLRILMTCGGGSIRKNGVYDQVRKALKGRTLLEFWGIEPNPEYETLMKAVKLARAKKAGFLLSVGGGSVLDGTKFIAAAVPFRGEPWDIVGKGAPVKKAVPLGCVMTLPATGSETNPFSVVSRRGIDDKRPFSSDLVLPKFAILDPETTFTLPERQTANGVVDAWVHVMEQYMTWPADAPLQDRQAEGIWLTLREVGPRLLAAPRDYGARASMMWCATQALNQLIAAGVPQDWATRSPPPTAWTTRRRWPSWPRRSSATRRPGRRPSSSSTPSGSGGSARGRPGSAWRPRSAGPRSSSARWASRPA